MRNTTIARTGLAGLIIPALLLGGAPGAQAADASLTRAQMNQIVSSADVAPVGLGPATQNLFVYVNKRMKTPVCLRANGNPVKLPGGRPSGTRGYTLTDTNTVVGTSVIQYPTLNAARAASKVLGRATCPSAASRTSDGGPPLIPVSQASDDLAPIGPNPGFIALTVDDQFATVYATRFAGTVAVSVTGTASAGQVQALEDWAKGAVDAAARQALAAQR